MNGLRVCDGRKEPEEGNHLFFQKQGSRLESYSKVECVTRAFKNSVVYAGSLEETRIPLFEQFCKTAVLYSDFYQYVLGDNFLCKMLKNDIINNSGHAIEAWRRETPSSKSVEDFLRSQIQMHTLNELRSNQNSAVVKFLWTVRTTNFIQQFIENLISSSGEDLRSSAIDAYNKSLKPYHGLVKVGIALMAFKIIRPKTEVIASLGYPDSTSGMDALRRLSSASRPCIDEINALVDKYNCNFQTKV